MLQLACRVIEFWLKGALGEAQAKARLAVASVR